MFVLSAALLICAISATSAKEITRLHCAQSQQPYFCSILGALLPREQSDYLILSREATTNITHFKAYSSMFSVINAEVCDTFVNLNTFDLQQQGVQVLQEDAFASCRNVLTIYLQTNLIQVLPEGVFRNNFKLQNLYLYNNRIIGISDNQFIRNPKLTTLLLGGNNIGTFPVTAIKNSPNLATLNLESNDLYDLDGIRLLQYALALKTVYLNNNLIRCDRLQMILWFLHKMQVETPCVLVQKDRLRIFQMSQIGNLNCVAEGCVTFNNQTTKPVPVLEHLEEN